MLLQACLNGALTKEDHPAVPVSVDELAHSAAECVDAGAASIHLHPRDSDGREVLDPHVIDSVVERVRATCGVPVCVSTGAWIEPRLERRLRKIQDWTQPDFATVNLSETGADQVMVALLGAQVGIEAGISDVNDVEQLAAFDLVDRITRILVEPIEVSPADALAVVTDIHAALDHHGATAPRLQHGDGNATWILVADAFTRGIDTRVGFEDTLSLPDGRPAASNAELVRAAAALRARTTRG